MVFFLLPLFSFIVSNSATPVTGSPPPVVTSVVIACGPGDITQENWLGYDIDDFFVKYIN